MIIDIGIDVSKGYSDFVALSQGSPVGEHQRFDDTPAGHASCWHYFDGLQAQGAQQLRFAVESTGGLEANWVRSVKKWRAQLTKKALATCAISVFTINPYAVKHLAVSIPGRCKTDQSSAHAIAAYLAISAAACVEKPEDDHCRSFFRSMMTLQEKASATINQIKSLLPQTHPCLVQHAQHMGLTNKICALLLKYPSTERLQKATIAGIASIPFITEEDAKVLKQDAQNTVAALSGPLAELHISTLVETYRAEKKMLAKQKKILHEHFCDRVDFHRLQSIKGIGEETAIAILAEVPCINALPNGNALIASVGIDPVFEQSGDGITQKGISHRGPARLRQVLYMATWSATVSNPLVRRFYQRLRKNGKPHRLALTACMGKLLRIAYACLVTETDFDPEHACKNQKPTAADNRNKPQPLGRKSTAAAPDTRAPVSRRERQRRSQQLSEYKKTAEPSRDQSLKKEGSSAALPIIKPEKEIQAMIPDI